MRVQSSHKMKGKGATYSVNIKKAKMIWKCTDIKLNQKLEFMENMKYETNICSSLDLMTIAT